MIDVRRIRRKTLHEYSDTSGMQYVMPLGCRDLDYGNIGVRYYN